MNQAAHGLTTIAAIPRTGGAGMALLGETNTTPQDSGLVPFPTSGYTVVLGRTVHGWLCTCRVCGVTRECDVPAMLCMHDV